MASSKNQTVQMYDPASTVQGADNYSIANALKSHDVGQLYELASRPWILAHFDWSASTTSYSYNLVDGNTQSWQQFFQWFAYLKAGIKITIKVNGTNFHQGCLVFALMPGSTDDVLSEPFGQQPSVYMMTSMPHVRVNASTSDQQEIIIPYNNVKEMMKRQLTITDTAYLGQLYMAPLNILQASAGSSSSIGVTLWVQPMLPEVLGYTIPEYGELPVNAHYQSACPICTSEPCVCGRRPPIQSVPQVQTEAAIKTDPIGGLLESAMGALNLNGVLSDIGGALGSVAEVVGPIAGLLDKPDVVEEPKLFMRKTAAGWGTVTGLNSGQTVSAFKQGVLKPPEEKDLFGMQTPTEYAKNFAAFTTLSINTGQAENTKLGAWYVAPSMCARGSWQVASTQTDIINTPLSYVAMGYTYWRGSIKYRLQFVATAFQQALVAVVWVPDSLTTDPLGGGYKSNVTRCYVDLVEVRGPTEYDFTIPFMGEYPVKDVPTSSTGYDGSNWPQAMGMSQSVRQRNQNAVNGTIYLYLVNVLVAPNNTPTSIECNVWAAAGDDLEFFVPCGPNLALCDYTGMDNWNVPPHGPAFNSAEEAGAKHQSASSDLQIGNETEPSGQLETVKNRDNEDLHNITDEDAQIEQMVELFGESHMSLTAAFKRWQFLMTGNYPIGAETGQHGIEISIPVTPSIWSQQIGSTVATETHHPTLLAYFGAMYRYWRGSLRYRIVVQGDKASHAHIVQARFRPLKFTKSSYGAEAAGGGTAYWDEDARFYVNDWDMGTGNAVQVVSNSFANSGMHLEQTYQQGVLDVVVPFYTYRKRCYSTIGENAVSIADRKPAYTRNQISGFLDILILQRGGTNAPDGMTINVFVAAGDDFTFSYPACAPCLKQKYKIT